MIFSFVAYFKKIRHKFETKGNTRSVSIEHLICFG